MDNGDKAVISFFWMLFGTALILFILLALGFSPLDLTQQGSGIAFTIVVTNVVVSLGLTFIFIIKDEQDLEEWRRRQAPIHLDAVRRARTKMIQKFPEFKNTINEVANEEEKRIKR